MSNLFSNFEFGPIKNTDMENTLRISLYGIAIKNVDGNFVAFNPETNDIINVDAFDFDIPDMIWAMPAPIKDIKIGDIIRHNKHYCFVKDIKDNTLDVIDISNGTVISVIPTKNMFNFNFVTKIITPIGNFKANEDNPFGNMLPFLMMNNHDFDMKNLLMFSMLNDGKLDMSNPLMLMLLLKNDNKDLGDVAPLILMSQLN